MNKSNNKNMQFLFGDRELVIQIADLLVAPVDVIVNPANGQLAHGGGVAGQISQQAGKSLQDESNLFIKEHGILESGMVAITSAGNLPYRAVIHAVGPKMGEGDEQRKIQLAVSRSLQLCDMHDWNSIAFPAISSGIFGVPIDVSARAFFRAITSYWDARIDASPERIFICLTEEKFRPFLDSFRDESFDLNEGENKKIDEVMKNNNVDAEREAGHVDLSDEDLSLLDNDEINTWFK